MSITKLQLRWLEPLPPSPVVRKLILTTSSRESFVDASLCAFSHFVGVGPMTIGMLMQNTLTNAKNRLGFEE